MRFGDGYLAPLLPQPAIALLPELDWLKTAVQKEKVDLPLHSIEVQVFTPKMCAGRS